MSAKFETTEKYKEMIRDLQTDKWTVAALMEKHKASERTIYKYLTTIDNNGFELWSTIVNKKVHFTIFKTK